MALSKKMLAIVGVLVVVVVVIIAAAALGGGNTKANDNNDNDNDNDNGDNTNTRDQIANVSYSGTGDKVSETFLPLDAGEHFVTVKFDVTNKASADGSAPALFWELHASNGQIYSMDFNAESSYPDGLQAGATASYVLVYAVADGATPTKLTYDGLTKLEVKL